MKAKKPRPLAVGTRLGLNLTVLGVIDGGSVEPVYIVWNDAAWCPMACKVMRSHERAEREAGVLSELAHPFIVSLMGVERPGYLLMPFLEGSLLADIIDAAPKQRLPLSDALRVAIHAGAALHHVHERGFLHLDVKPGNFIITPGGRAILFDFGSARRIGATRPTEIIGTNPYIAPEECRLSEAGPAADVFSLAVTLYEMLTGELPFGPSTENDPFPQLDREAKPLKDLRKDVPEALENLLFACLESRPDFRPLLAELLPAFNGFIIRGPKMWPDGFNPGPCRAPAKKSHARRHPSLRLVEAAPCHSC